jgi:hypothetical protein
MGRARWLAVAVLAVGTATPSATAATGTHFKPCVRPGLAPPFPVYWVGRGFAGLRLSGRPYYSCGAPPGRVTRVHALNFVYGICPRSCGSPPLQIITTPACDLNLSLHTRWVLPAATFTPLRIRGVPAMAVGADPVWGADGVSVDDRPFLEIYTGDVTVAIHGSDGALRRRAANAMRRAVGLQAVGVASALPPPVPEHLTGRLDCGLAFTKVTAVAGAPTKDVPPRREVTFSAELPRPGQLFLATRSLDHPRESLGFLGGGAVPWPRQWRRAISLVPGRWELVFRARDRAGRTAVRTIRLRVPPV